MVLQALWLNGGGTNDSFPATEPIPTGIANGSYGQQYAVGTLRVTAQSRRNRPLAEAPALGRVRPLKDSWLTSVDGWADH
jgi:hypothetical protein